MNKKLTITTTAVLFVVLISGFIGWRYVKAMPEYSMHQLYGAARERDYEMVKKYFDIDTVASNLVDQVISESTKENPGESEAEQWGSDMAEGILFAMKPQLKEEIVSGFRKEIEEGEFIGEDSPHGLLELMKQTEVTKNGKTADVTIIWEDGEERTFKMREKDGYWQVFNVNFDMSDMDVDNPETNAETQTDKTQRVDFGTRVDLTSGWFLTVNKPELYEPTNYFDEASEGNKYISIEATYENTSSLKNSFSTERLKLRDTENHIYDPYWLGVKEPSLDSSDLEPGGTIKGYITYEIPEDMEPKEVVYSSDYATIVFGKSE